MNNSASYGAKPSDNTSGDYTAYANTYPPPKYPQQTDYRYSNPIPRGPPPMNYANSQPPYYNNTPYSPKQPVKDYPPYKDTRGFSNPVSSNRSYAPSSVTSSYNSRDERTSGKPSRFSDGRKSHFSDKPSY